MRRLINTFIAVSALFSAGATMAEEPSHLDGPATTSRPRPANPLYPLHYHRLVVFERVDSAMRPILVSGDDAAFVYGKPQLIRYQDRVLRLDRE
jgi:hypothetical protein